MIEQATWKREDGFDRNEVITERHERTLRRLYAGYDPEPYHIEVHYDTRRQPTPQELNLGMKVKANRLRLELLPLQLPPPPQYDLPPWRSPARLLPGSPPCSSPLPCTEPESSGDDQIESDCLEALADGQEEEQ